MPPRNRTRRGPGRSRLLLGTALLVGFAILGYLFAALVLFPAPIFATAQAVPLVVGVSLQDARATLSEAGLTTGEVETVTHPTRARGTVVWQDPPPGVEVLEGTAVSLSVSGGPQRVPVPDLTGYDVTIARRLLEAAGLAVGRVDSSQAPVERGVVVNTRPPAGATLRPGTPVTLVVSVGAPTISVPNLVGLTLEEAGEVLDQTRLKLGTWVPQTSLSAEPGTIISQDPAPATLAAPGVAVDVTVARRPRR
ncbi:MAG: PASTA domain-containing protein [Gemmatimonadales bacterium]